MSYLITHIIKIINASPSFYKIYLNISDSNFLQISTRLGKSKYNLNCDFILEFRQIFILEFFGLYLVNKCGFTFNAS